MIVKSLNAFSLCSGGKRTNRDSFTRLPRRIIGPSCNHEFSSLSQDKPALQKDASDALALVTRVS